MKKIGIIGSGIVGKTLAKGFVKHGYPTMIGTRNSQKKEDLLTEFGNSIQIGDFSQTAEFAEIIVLAVPGKKALEALNLCGEKNICGKTIMDVTNPIDELPPENGVLRFFTGLNASLMEQLSKVHVAVHFVKAFNSVGSAMMVNPDFKGIKPTMFICGNNDASKADVTEIISKFGWEVEDMGKAEAARAIEPLCMLWCIPGLRENKWNHAFKLLRS